MHERDSRCVAPASHPAQHSIAINEPVKQLMAQGMEGHEVFVLLAGDPSVLALDHAAVLEVMQLQVSRSRWASARSARQGNGTVVLLGEPPVPTREPHSRAEVAGSVAIPPGTPSTVAHDASSSR